LSCVILGTLGAALWLLSLTRSIRAIVRCAVHNRRIARVADKIYFPQHRSSALVLDAAQPLLALIGLLRPRLIVSRGLLQSLSAQELDAALTHEQAHRSSRDNLKRLLLLLAPDTLPFFNPLRALEPTWGKFTEWAADDCAAAGNPQRALSLAAALLRVARVGSTPTLPYLSTSLLARDCDLEIRVDRLLHPAALPKRSRLRFRAVVVFGALAVGALLLAPSTLSFIHELQELLLH